MAAVNENQIRIDVFGENLIACEYREIFLTLITIQFN